MRGVPRRNDAFRIAQGILLAPIKPINSPAKSRLRRTKDAPEENEASGDDGDKEEKEESRIEDAGEAENESRKRKQKTT